MSLNRLVLVLNAAYEPVNTCSARRAFTLVCKGVAVVEASSGAFVRTGRLTLPVPSVIRLVTYRYVPRRSRAVSRKNILLRDGGRCQYCARPFPTAEFTLDHVIPRSRGGGSTWENLVSACKPCNNRKGDRTPAEAGMTLLKRPAQITIHAKHKLLQGSDDKSWERYLFN